MTMVRSLTSRLSDCAMIRRFSATGRSRSTLPRAGAPTTSFSMYVSGACRRPPGSDTAMTAHALGRPFATGFVPSRGSTAMWTSGPSPRPTRSPMKSIGASSRSPSPMTIIPLKRASSIVLRIASTAAWSASLLFPWPIQCAAAIAAASVMRTSSRLGVRSAGMRSSGRVPLSCIGAVTLVRNHRSRTYEAFGCVLDEWERLAHRLCDRHALPRDGDGVESDRFVALPEPTGDSHHRNARASRCRGHRTGQLPVSALPIYASFSGDDEIGARDALGEAHRTQHELRTGDEARVEEREQSGAQSARRPRTGHVADRASHEPFDDVRISRDRRFELPTDLGCGTFLRPVYPGP